MDKLVDINGIEIKEGSLIRVKGSKIVRRVWRAELWDGKLIAFNIATTIAKNSKVDPARVEVIG